MKEKRGGIVRRKQDRRRTSAVTVEQIQRRAYDIYEARGSAPGHALDDWLQAEEELTGKGQVLENRGDTGSSRRSTTAKLLNADPKL